MLARGGARSICQCVYSAPLTAGVPAQVFTVASDVWSFGVTMGEVYNAGEQPYAGISATELLGLFEQKYRMPQPTGCPDAVYATLLRCWASEPADRPTFNDIVAFYELEAAGHPHDGESADAVAEFITGAAAASAKALAPSHDDADAGGAAAGSLSAAGNKAAMQRPLDSDGYVADGTIASGLAGASRMAGCTSRSAAPGGSLDAHGCVAHDNMVSVSRKAAVTKQQGAGYLDIEGDEPACPSAPTAKFPKMSKKVAREASADRCYRCKAKVAFCTCETTGRPLPRLQLRSSQLQSSGAGRLSGTLEDDETRL